MKKTTIAIIVIIIIIVLLCTCKSGEGYTDRIAWMKTGDGEYYPMDHLPTATERAPRVQEDTCYYLGSTLRSVPDHVPPSY